MTIINRGSVATLQHPIFTDAPVAIAAAAPVPVPVFNSSSAPNSFSVGPIATSTPISTATGQNVQAGSAPTQAFAEGTSPVLYSTQLGYASVGMPGTGAGAAISSSSTVSASPSFEAETGVVAANGAPNTANNVPVASSIESAVQADLPGGTLLSSLPTWFWLVAAALVAYLWYTGESPKQVVDRVTA
jgi:hypothetical protein